MTENRRWFVRAVLVAVVLSFVGLASESISLHDESRVAGIGREMMDAGSYSMPLLNGRPFLEKPPLYWWVQIGGYRVFGISDAVARLPSAIFGFLTLLLAFAMGRRLGGGRCGFLTMLALATFAGFFDLVHRCLVDPALVFAVTLGAYGFLLWIDPEDDRQRFRGALLWGVAVPLSWLAKGVAGPAFTVGAPILHLLFARRFRQLAKAWFPAAVALGLTLFTVVPYLLALKAAGGPDAVKEMVFGQTFSRVLGGPEDEPSHAKPIWWYLSGSPGRLVPWLILLPALLKSHVIRRRKKPDATARRSMAGYFVFGLLLLSVATDKRGIYVVPLLPALAAPIGYWLATLHEEGPDRDWDRPTLMSALGVLALVPALIAVAMLVLKFGGLTHRRYALDVMGEAVTPALLVFTIAAGAAGTFWLGRGFLRFKRSGDTPGPLWILVPMAAALLFFQTGVRSIQDAGDTGRPLVSKIAEIVPEDSYPLLMKGRESLIGYLYFDHQRHMRTFYDPGRLLEHLSNGTGTFVVAEEPDFEELPEAIRERFDLRWMEEHRKKDPYGIWEWDGRLPD